jgi:WhiB family redox-sensing transcriptional regulator
MSADAVTEPTETTRLQLPADFDWSLLFTDEDVDTRWMDYALCAAVPDPDTFFPAKHRKADAARAICRRCPVEDECLAYAQATRTPEGVWGGKSARPRRKMRGDMQRAAAEGDPGLAL